MEKQEKKRNFRYRIDILLKKAATSNAVKCKYVQLYQTNNRPISFSAIASSWNNRVVSGSENVKTQ